MIKPCIIGLGYVGLPILINLSKRYRSIGYDNNLRRINDLKNGKRKYILIPDTAHGTNFASIVIGGYDTRVLKSDSRGRVDLADLRSKLDQDLERGSEEVRALGEKAENAVERATQGK